MTGEPTAKMIAVMVCDLERSPLGTASRLQRRFGNETVLRRAMGTVAAVSGIDQLILLSPAEQLDQVRAEADAVSQHISHAAPMRVMELAHRPEALDIRIRRARAWDNVSWRGGAGQWTVFDEDYHPLAVATAVKETGADHVLCVPAHGALLDSNLLAALVRHHLHKNHEMRFTYTPAAPGLCGIILQAGIVAEMAAVPGGGVTPGMLLGYDPKAPNFDSLIREACMQVDPALSKIQNRFLLDTDRAWKIAEVLLARMPFESAAAMALAARDLPLEIRAALPREIEIELTGRRKTTPPGSVPALIREARGELDAAKWTRWISEQNWGDDTLVTFCGDGDPLLYGGLTEVLEATRAAGAASICVQTDLLPVCHAQRRAQASASVPTDKNAAEHASDMSHISHNAMDTLLAAMQNGLVDVISIPFYGDDAATYAKVSGCDAYPAVLKNMMKLAPVAAATGTVVVPRLLKVRDTIPQMEGFFDKWILQGCWVVFDGPTDRAGGVDFAGVVDMAPPKRRPCRRIADRLLIRANGNAVACDQDMNDRLLLGNIENKTLGELWLGDKMKQLREAHAGGKWGEVSPCNACREWHRA